MGARGLPARRDQTSGNPFRVASHVIRRETSMDSIKHSSGINRRLLLSTLATLPALSTVLQAGAALAQAPGGVLPSWNDGAAKQAIVNFVRATTDRSSPSYVAPEERIA